MEIHARLEIMLWNVAIPIMKLLGAVRTRLESHGSQADLRQGLLKRVLVLCFSGFLVGFLIGIVKIWLQS